MAGYKLQCQLTALVSVQEAFKVFENPYNLAAITPPSLGFKILTPNLQMKKGVEIDYELRPFGFPLRWKTIISEYEPPFLFVDTALKSPYSYWRHRHQFRPTDNGTVVSDEVEYGVPFGPLGALAHTLVVSRQLLSIFSFRQKAIAELLGGKVTEIRPASTELADSRSAV